MQKNTRFPSILLSDDFPATPDVCQELAKDFRARNPQGKIVEILAANWKAPMNRPDATALSPEELIAAIRGFA